MQIPFSFAKRHGILLTKIDNSIAQISHRSDIKIDILSTGIYELINIDKQLNTMIHDQIGQHELEKYAHKHHATLQQDGMRLVTEGKTSMEELLRVTSS
jgi:type II secretory ATPase GspE/PulE/Tfp pilus assembly ATPase PilB-like protein